MTQSETVRVYHITPRRNLDSIRMHGIDPRYSQGDLRAVWFVAGCKIRWALLHCAKRHSVSRAQLIILYADVSIDVLKRHAVKHLFYATESVTATGVYALSTDRHQPNSTRHE